MKYLPFSVDDDVNRYDEKGKVDRAWKIIKISDILNERFPKAYDTGRWISFDEAILQTKVNSALFVLIIL